MLLFCLRRQAPIMNYCRHFILHSYQNVGLSLPRVENTCLRYSNNFSSNSNIFHNTFTLRGSTLRTFYQPTRSFSAFQFGINKSYVFTKYCCRTCLNITQRTISGSSKGGSVKRRSTLIYVSAIWIFMFGMAYAGVPLYRIFCQAAGLGGQAVRGNDSTKVETMTKIEDRLITVKFNADVASSMRWNFRPQQTQVKVLPGETALAFYTAKNPTDRPIVGISTYNVIPYEAGPYFNKIQCFCFEEQRLNPHEQVDMPVFFYIDPEFDEDPKLQGVDIITLSYTFFEAKEGLQLPLPGYPQVYNPQ